MGNNVERAASLLPKVDDPPGVSAQVDRTIVAMTAPTSGAAEQFRTLYYRLERMRDLRPLKVVALTSALASEGKTVTAVNLALTAARANPEKRILLIDADLRRSRVAECLGIRLKPGLSDLVAGECELREAVHRLNGTRLAVLAAGSDTQDATYLLASGSMRQLIKNFRESFDEIYIDLPPTLPFADAPIIGVQADGVLLVIRANITPSKAVSQALEHLGGTPVIGCVLNGAEVTSEPYFKSYLGP